MAGFVIISFHQPRPDKENLVIDSMHRYGETSKKFKGLIGVYTLKNDKTGQLIGLAIWNSEESYKAARPELIKTTQSDDFDAWEMTPVTVHRLRPV